MSNVQTVQDMYGAFGRGDVAAILDHLSDDVSWDADATAGVPWLESRRGRANVAGFFASLAPVEFHAFEPHTFFESGNRVFALVRIDAQNRGTGVREVIANEGHLWEFGDDGKVVAYQHVTDTAKHQRLAASG